MKSIVITGATGGIGKALLEALLKKGNFRIGVVGRNKEKLEGLKKLPNATNNQILLYQADLSSMDATKKAAQQILNDFESIDFLINNAGAYIPERIITSENFEMTLATNYLSTFLLNKLLVDSVKKTAAENGEAQIINTGSIGHKRPINWNDLNYKEGKFDAPLVYEHSKHLMISHTFDLSKQLKDTNVRVNTIHPGFVTSNLIKGKKMPFPMNILTRILPIFIGITPEKAKDVYLWLMFEDAAKNLRGEYIDNKKIGKVWEPTKDEKAQERLRLKTEKMIAEFQ